MAPSRTVRRLAALAAAGATMALLGLAPSAPAAGDAPDLTPCATFVPSMPQFDVMIMRAVPGTTDEADVLRCVSGVRVDSGVGLNAQVPAGGGYTFQVLGFATPGAAAAGPPGPQASLGVAHIAPGGGRWAGGMRIRISGPPVAATVAATGTGTDHVDSGDLQHGVVAALTLTPSAAGPSPGGPAPGNHPPVANADRLVPGKWLAPVAVLANDTDEDGDALAVARVEPMKCGRLVIGADRRTIAFEPPPAGCRRRQRGVYVATDGKAESNRASFFVPPIAAAPATGRHHGRTAAQRFTVLVHLVYDDGGVRYAVTRGSIVVTTKTGALITRRGANAAGVVTLVLTRGMRIHITAQAVAGDCTQGSPEQLVMKRAGYVTTPSAGRDPDNQTLPLPIVQRIACPVPDLP